MCGLGRHLVADCLDTGGRRMLVAAVAHAALATCEGAWDVILPNVRDPPSVTIRRPPRDWSHRPSAHPAPGAVTGGSVNRK